ncbi:MAG: MerR family transcriptional regulator, partial [Longimicrobiales bacterium]
VAMSENMFPWEDEKPAENEPPLVAESAPAREPVARSRSIARKEYYSIGEVSDLVGLPAHVLRYWESQFPVLNPSKNRSGNRAYQRKEIRLILLVKQLLYEDKFTVEGAKSRLEQLRKGGELAGVAASVLDRDLLALLRQDVTALRQVLSGPRA